MSPCRAIHFRNPCSPKQHGQSLAKLRAAAITSFAYLVEVTHGEQLSLPLLRFGAPFVGESATAK